jgi:ABC-type multidrug transport system fused ATPase/permease subunit
MSQVPFDSFGAKKVGFWRRQFTQIPTRAQDTFDTIFAVVMPIIVLLADPIVFKGGEGFWNRGLLEDYQLLAYVVCSLQIGLFLTWRTWRRSLIRWAPAFAGIFFAGALFSSVIGVVLLPFSLIGLIVLIGALGFTPLLTAFVFLRNGVRTARIRGRAATVKSRFMLAVMTGVLVIALPVLMTWQVERTISASVNDLISADEVQSEQAARELRWFRFVPDKYRRRIAIAHANSIDPVRRQTLNEAYRNITGEDLELRRHYYAD